MAFDQLNELVKDYLAKIHPCNFCEHARVFRNLCNGKLSSGCDLNGLINVTAPCEHKS